MCALMHFLQCVTLTLPSNVPRGQMIACMYGTFWLAQIFGAWKRYASHLQAFHDQILILRSFNC